jgi:hypothetical protein
MSFMMAQSIFLCAALETVCSAKSGVVFADGCAGFAF